MVCSLDWWWTAVPCLPSILESHLKINHSRVFLHWFYPLRKDFLLWARGPLLPCQGCCLVASPTLDQGYGFLWSLQEGTCKRFKKMILLIYWKFILQRQVNFLREQWRQHCQVVPESNIRERVKEHPLSLQEVNDRGCSNSVDGAI